MSLGDPMWKTVLDAARQLGERQRGIFTRAEIVNLSHDLDPSHHERAYSAMFQTMVIEAPTIAASPVGKVFNRIGHGRYIVSPTFTGVAVLPIAKTAAPVRRSRQAQSFKHSDAQGLVSNSVQYRVDLLKSNFDNYLAGFSNNVPFTRYGQWEFHRATILRRRELGSVLLALYDEKFLNLLYKTLQAWGIGRRGSHLVDRTGFDKALQSHANILTRYENMSIEDPRLDVLNVGTALANLTSNLGIVENISRIVPGTKALHHLLPDLVPPLDRQWSGWFFNWKPTDPQSAHERTFMDAFTKFVNISHAVSPSQFIDNRWNTSMTKVLDNAMIGFCQSELVGDVPIANKDISDQKRVKQPDDVISASGAITSSGSPNIISVAESSNSSPLGSYLALSEFLAVQEGMSVSFLFRHIERLIGRELPNPARTYRAWWANAQSGSHSHANSWLDVGWRVKHVDLNSNVVTFTRVPPGPSQP